MTKSKLVKANKKITDTVVGSYKVIEKTVVDGYKKIEDKFVDQYLTKEGETIEEAKERMKNEHEELHKKNQEIVNKSKRREI